jgi:hypothetical protein
MPLIQTGAIEFHPLVDLSGPIREAVKKDTQHYLWSNIEVLESHIQSYPPHVKCRVPLMDYATTVEVDNNIGREFSLSAQELAAIALTPLVSLHSSSALAGLRAADAIEGSFWTGLDWLWEICHSMMTDLSPHARIYSFLHQTTQPAIKRAAASELVSLRSQDDALYAFRRELILSEHLLVSRPNDPGFSSEVEELFSDIFLPSLRIVEASMQRNSILSKLPWFAGSVGFAYAAAASSSSPLNATIFGTLSAALGFGSLFAELSDPEASVRKAPAYIYWKLASED